MRPEEVFLANLELIDRFARSACRRLRMEPADAEDFTSALKLRLIEDDYAILRKFEERSSLSTFLHIVVQRFSLDYRNREWGRWRPSAEAQRQGEIGVLFERCRDRDEMTTQEACDSVRQRHPHVDANEVLKIAAMLPQREPRIRRKGEGDAVLQSMAAPRTADEALLAGERLASAEGASAAFARALREITPEDQLILRLRFGKGLKVATIASMLQRDPKRLYTTLERLMRNLRKALLAEGLTPSAVSELLEHGAEGFEIPFLQDEGIAAAQDACLHLVKDDSAGAGQADS